MTASANKKEYHYDLLERNRERVREQGTAIKKLRSISDPDVPVLVQRKRDETDITQQHVTLPAMRAVDQRLKIALEEAEAARDSSPPSAKKKWYRWPD
jgi:methyl coenzyme M reductase gamma subunit